MAGSAVGKTKVTQCHPVDRGITASALSKWPICHSQKNKLKQFYLKYNKDVLDVLAKCILTFKKPDQSQITCQFWWCCTFTFTLRVQFFQADFSVATAHQLVDKIKSVLSKISEGNKSEFILQNLGEKRLRKKKNGIDGKDNTKLMQDVSQTREPKCAVTEKNKATLSRFCSIISDNKLQLFLKYSEKHWLFTSLFSPPVLMPTIWNKII